MAIIVEREKEGIGQIEVRTPWVEAKLPTRREIKFIYSPAPAEEVPPPSPPHPSFWEQYKVPIMIGGGILLLILLLRK